MRCPTLSELPSPPPGKTGWPWTEESSQLPGAMPNGNSWPRISIVTPSYNQGQFLEETIRSVLLQGYPDLEYIVMDGGSTDGAVEIIKKYERWITYWVSKKDEGQAQAINKGFENASGVLYAWINSDDYYFSDSFCAIAEKYAENGNNQILMGYGDVIDLKGNFLKEVKVTNVVYDSLLVEWGNNWFLQQAVFWPSVLWDKVGGLNAGLMLLMDVDLWVRFSRSYNFVFIDKKVGVLRWYPNAKSCALRERGLAEWWLLLVRHSPPNQALEELNKYSRKLYQLENILDNVTSNFIYRILKKLKILREEL